MSQDAAALKGLEGSGEIVTQQDLERSNPVSVQDALRSVPGVHVVDNNSAGAFGRIGIRGLNPDMSKKVLLLEDGAPIALGPYTDPAAYYTPPVERMESIEVLKGSASLRYGPSTIGGAINYQTRDFSGAPSGGADASADGWLTTSPAPSGRGTTVWASTRTEASDKNRPATHPARSARGRQDIKR